MLKHITKSNLEPKAHSVHMYGHKPCSFYIKQEAEKRISESPSELRTGFYDCRTEELVLQGNWTDGQFELFPSDGQPVTGEGGVGYFFSQVYNELKNGDRI